MIETVFKYYKVNFSPIGKAQVWLFEIIESHIVKEIGIDKEGNTILILPNSEFPRGLFGDSPISFNQDDMIEISKVEFEKRRVSIIKKELKQ